MRYLLDTDTCICAIKGDRGVLGAILATPPSEVAVSVITEGELRAGASKSSAPRKAADRVDRFLGPLEVLELTSEDSVAYAKVRSRLEKKGAPIGPLDFWIAAHAVARDLTLVTNNEREFRRVPGLKLDNWRSLS